MGRPAHRRSGIYGENHDHQFSHLETSNSPVIDVQRRNDTLGQNACAKTSWRAPSHTPLKDQLHLIGSAKVQILADDLFEEDASRLRTVENLRQRELRLQDRNVILIAGLALSGSVGMWYFSEPLAQQPIDQGCRQAVANLLQPLGIGA